MAFWGDRIVVDGGICSCMIGVLVTRPFLQSSHAFSLWSTVGQSVIIAKC